MKLKFINLGWLWPKIINGDFKQRYNAKKELKHLERLQTAEKADMYGAISNALNILLLGLADVLKILKF